MADVKCVGHETKLVDCSYSTTGVCNKYYWRHKKDIGVVCGSTPVQEPYGDIRLVDGSSALQGRVEIYGRSGYGTVCGSDIILNFAKVVCRQLGYSSTDAKLLPSDVVNVGVGQTWITEKVCHGDEKRLDLCEFHGWGFNTGSSYRLDVGVSCEN
ncbi:lysyl oxidase homolog 2-like [Mizuhopecten yessoensis]|uniref:lysyl oxidase homolog 2-like n=1 Tax=Mizuhopecten yessoensis TaxID=6573 RepID=UPI000B45BE3D|nr:lysyl oxidase homolog 2-like [Mizuhopecten yessoensis]